MASENKTSKKLTLVPLILMIFTSVFGFTNIPRSYFLMGYAAIPWFILSGITFFIPYAFMMTEFGPAFKNEKGGIYSWMEKSVGPRFAFVGTFMWYASYVVWMVNICSTIWIPFSNAIFGTDTTASWSVLGLKSTQLLGILGILLVVLITFTSTKGLDQIKKVTSVGGTAVALLNIVLLVGALTVLIANGGLSQPIVYSSFTVSPNPAFASPISVLSFLVYAVFAYGGIEVVGGLVDETKNPEKTFPRGLTASAIIITVGYSIGIFLVGTFSNWQFINMKGAHIGNIVYVIMNNLGYQIGLAFNLSQAAASSIGAWVARFVGLSMFLSFIGSFITFSYSPLKQIIEGTPAKLWPGKMGELKDGMPINAMWVQCTAVIAIIILLTIGGEAAAKFFQLLINMTNVAMTLPNLFIAFSFIFFKRKEEIHKPFTIYKSYSTALVWTIIVLLTVAFANFFTIIAPAVDGDYKSTLTMIAGPIIFTLIALLMFANYERKIKKEKLEDAA